MIILVASVGFEAVLYRVVESAGFIEVCVVSKGYGFSVNLTLTDIHTTGKLVQVIGSLFLMVKS